MVKTYFQRAIEARVLNNLRLAFKIDKIREAVFGQQGYDAKTRKGKEGLEREISTDDSITAEGGKDKRKAMTRSLNYKLREEADIEEILMKLQKLSKLVRTNVADSHSGAEVILVCETLNGRWAASGSERRITAKDFLEYYVVKYVTATDGAYFLSSSSRPCFFDLSSAGRVWNDNLLWVSGEYLQRSDEEPLELNNKTITKGINYKVLRKESFIDVITREGTELEVVLKELEISLMEEKLPTPELNALLKLVRLNEIPDSPVDVATVSSTVVRNLAKRKAIKRGAAPRSVTSVSVDDSSKRRKVTSPTKSQEVLEESDKFAHALRDVQLGFQDRSMKLEKKISQLDGEKNQAESEAEAERLVTAPVISWNNLAGKLYQLRYTKVEIMAFSEGNYEEMEIMDVEEVKERDDGLNVIEKTATDNQETINQMELDVAREREERTLLYNAEYVKEYEFLFSQYEGRLDDNVKLSLKLEGAKRQVEQKIATILSRDLALNQLTSELAELKEKVALGSRHEAELAEYHIRALNEERSDMKCNIRALNEQLLKREIELDTAQTNFAVPEADFEKLSNNIMGKDRELRNFAQIRDSLIARLDRVKADLHRLKGNVRRAVQREKEMNEIINQLCARISKLEWELRVREMKYHKDLKFELDKRDGEIAFAELAESKARPLKDNKRTAVTHQAFKEIVVHQQKKYDGEVLHQRQLSALVAFFVEEIKFLQVERDLMQDFFSGRTCVCKLDISSIDPIGVMDCGIGTTTTKQIARGRKIVVERAPEYMASRTEIRGSSSVVSPTPVVGGRWSPQAKKFFMASASDLCFLRGLASIIYALIPYWRVGLIGSEQRLTRALGLILQAEALYGPSSGGVCILRGSASIIYAFIPYWRVGLIGNEQRLTRVLGLIPQTEALYGPSSGGV
ncbi:hypothetical protein GIB67_037567 [Kingdonia uniflora]|uniref:Uncharacterized protein n=1 Tax=Kingdonia uniflora TaxID=39325 RepID=A0A7J7LSN4_9MAGN|nr:hypothetical protein GIB67_037567 [Kingdonia uniflora]